MPSILRRPVLLARGMLVSRKRPNLAHLGSIEDPERFAWAIVPHVARSFAASIVMLPRAEARAALVGYLYSRMLDTYEDMVLDHEQKVRALGSFRERFSTGRVPGPAPSVEVSTSSARQEVDKLLVNRCDLVDRLFATLPDRDRAVVVTLVTEMAASMAKWSEVFVAQRGLLETADQLSRYCDDVIGGPSRFVMALISSSPLSDSQRRSTATISEMVQLANVTRDIEYDLARGIGYHPALKPYLGVAPVGVEAREQVRKVREELLVRALKCIPAYPTLLGELRLPAFSSARGSAVLLLLFTDRHYRGCAVDTGHQPWPGQKWTMVLLLDSVLSIVSRRWANRTLRRIQTNFLHAASAIESSISSR